MMVGAAKPGEVGERLGAHRLAAPGAAAIDARTAAKAASGSVSPTGRRRGIAAMVAR